MQAKLINQMLAVSWWVARACKHDFPLQDTDWGRIFPSKVCGLAHAGYWRIENQHLGIGILILPEIAFCQGLITSWWVYKTINTKEYEALEFHERGFPCRPCQRRLPVWGLRVQWKLDVSRYKSMAGCFEINMSPKFNACEPYRFQCYLRLRASIFDYPDRNGKVIAPKTEWCVLGNHGVSTRFAGGEKARLLSIMSSKKRLCLSLRCFCIFCSSSLT